MSTINSVNNTFPSGITVSGGTANINSAAADQATNIGNTIGASQMALKFGTSDFSLASATGTIISALDTGEVTTPLTTAFLAYNSVTDTNQTGNGATVTVQFDSIVFDLNSDFASNTLTAAVTGKYSLSTCVVYGGITLANSAVMSIVTSNRTYASGYTSPVAVKDSGGLVCAVQSVICDMDNADVATVTLICTGEAGNTNSIYGTSNPVTYFCGYLAC